MAKWGDEGDSKWGIRRRWGDEKDEKNAEPSEGQKIDEILRRVEPLMEQVNNLYNQFATGVERLAPVERRTQLDQLMTQLQALQKPNQTYSFRVGTIQQRYSTLTTRWSKLLKDLESGKIKRIVGPKRPGDKGR